MDKEIIRFDNGQRFKRISKPEARRLHEANRTVYMLPSKVNPYFGDGMFFGRVRPRANFDSEVNAFCYYNCNSELGKTVKFYAQM